MKKAAMSILVVVMLLAVLGVSQAQQLTKAPTIGYLVGASLSGIKDRMDAFRQGLQELGYVEGKNIVIEWRSSEEKLDRLPVLAAELVRGNVNIIVTAGGPATRAAKEATSTIPIVMTNDVEPVANGFVASLARPGGNITGLSNLAPELAGKRLEILREVIPKLSRVAVLGSSADPVYARTVKELELAAKAFGVKLQHLNVLDSKDVAAAFRAASNGRADALLTINSPILISNRAQIVELAAKSRLPAMYSDRRFTDAGMMFYGVNIFDLDRRAAVYVDKILKGAKPADLPVEQPMKFEFIINLKAAKQIGLMIPPNILARADRVIK
jgi:putative tryptophan/tyrosine transport system substrate-binding protein